MGEHEQKNSMSKYTYKPRTQESHRTKKITYFCGCTVLLSAWAEKDAGFACLKHSEPIEEIVETTTYMKLK